MPTNPATRGAEAGTMETFFIMDNRTMRTFLMLWAPHMCLTTKMTKHKASWEHKHTLCEVALCNLECCGQWPTPDLPIHLNRSFQATRGPPPDSSSVPHFKTFPRALVLLLVNILLVTSLAFYIPFGMASLMQHGQFNKAKKQRAW